MYLGKQNKVTLKGAAIIVMSSIVISRITGFIREMLVPNMIGVNEVGDAYTIAFKITGLMYDLLVGGAISSALIPILSGYIVKDKEEEGWKAVSTFVNIVFLAMVIFCVLGMIFTPQIMPLVAVGFKTEYQRRLAIRLTRILFPSVCFLMLAGFSNGILNSYNRFAVASYGPCIYNIGCAASIYFLGKTKGGVSSIACGVTISSFIYFLFQISAAQKNMKFYRPKIFLKHDGFRKLFKLAIPSMISSSIVQINVLISSTFSSLFKAGSVTAFNMADRVWQMPYGIFAQGIATAILPSLSAKLAVGKVDEFKKTWLKSLKMVLLLTIPSAVGFVMLRQDIIRSIFKFTNKFNDEFVVVSANVLMYFSIALITQSLVLIITRAFYAYNDTKTPLYIGTSTIILNLLLSFVFCKFTNLNVSGMALAYSIASTVNAVVLFVVFNKRTGKLIDKDILKFCQKVILGSIFMALALGISKRFGNSTSMTKLWQVIDLVKQISIGVVVYFVSIWFMKVNEVQEIIDMVLRKLRLKRA